MSRRKIRFLAPCCMDEFKRKDWGKEKLVQHGARNRLLMIFCLEHVTAGIPVLYTTANNSIQCRSHYFNCKNMLQMASTAVGNGIGRVKAPS